MSANLIKASRMQEEPLKAHIHTISMEPERRNRPLFE